jgi:UDP-N-acetylglucosamine 2-epimerase (non-hydrolysing)
VHPRTKKNLEKNGLYSDLENAIGIHLDAPVSYVPFMNLLFNCKLTITDSGGIQEETTYLGIPCLTLRPNTERPITVTQGTNKLVDVHDLEEKVNVVLSGSDKETKMPELWDGKTATRVVKSIQRALKVNNC